MIAERPQTQEPVAAAPTQESASKPKSRWLGGLFGVFLFLYACAHAKPGMAATLPTSSAYFIWPATAGWVIAAGSFVLAAYGLWGFPGLARRWRMLAALGAAASLALLMGTGQWSLWPMMVLNGLILSLAIDSSTPALPKKKRGILKRSGFLLVQLLALALWLYGAAAIAARPWHQVWGATDTEVAKMMPGDRDKLHAYAINHVVTVNAPAEKVWPWLVQVGQGKAGFYSYDWLERAAGTGIHNVYQIKPEWQQLKAGDFIRACPPDWFGGKWKDSTGWHVSQIVPQRLMLLENWGPFWLEPIGDGRTRLGVRTEIGNVPFWAAPIEVFGFEPAHFIMDQKMLQTIKELAERPT